MKPFVKWAGGKRQILTRIKGYIDDSLDGETSYRYIEPFIGGGAVFFAMTPKRAIINDLNSDLINAYRVIRSDRYEELIESLKEYAAQYRPDEADDLYYEVRAQDRGPNWPDGYTDVQRAARMIFLNKTCYNGLYRVNSKGQFNTPMGRYRNPLICDEENIREIHDYLSNPENDIEIMNASYEEAISKAKDGDVIYIDPPYDYEDDDGFTKYQMHGFTFEDFQKLKECCDNALNKGAFVIISNNATQKVMDLFSQDPRYKVLYVCDNFTTLRSINSNGAGRRSGKEVIYWGMDANIPFPQANDLEKIIRLVMAGDIILEETDKQTAMSILEVGTSRQVAYYFSALKFLSYLTNSFAFTDKAKELRQNESALRSDIFNQLKTAQFFSETYDEFYATKKPDIEAIARLLKTKDSKLSDSTLKRRASTIKAWVTWMYDYDKLLNHKNENQQ